MKTSNREELENIITKSIILYYTIKETQKGAEEILINRKELEQDIDMIIGMVLDKKIEFIR